MYMYSAYSIQMVACPSTPVDLIPPGDTVVNFADAEDQLNDNELAVAHEHLCTCLCVYMYIYNVGSFVVCSMHDCSSDIP